MGKSEGMMSIYREIELNDVCLYEECSVSIKELLSAVNNGMEAIKELDNGIMGW